MVQVIQRNRTPAEIAAESLGQGIAGGLGHAIEGFQRQQQQTVTATALGSLAGFDENRTKLLGMLPVELQQMVVENVAKRQKAKAGGLKALTNEFSFYPKGSFESDDRDKIRASQDELIDQGYSPEQAAKMAVDNFRNPPQTTAQQGLAPQPQMQTGEPGTAEAKRIAPLTQKTLSPNPEVYGQPNQGPGFWNRVLQGTGRGAAMQAEMAYQPEALTQIPAGFTEGATLGAVDVAEPETAAGRIFREGSKFFGFTKTATQASRKAKEILKPERLPGKWGKILGEVGAGTAAGATVLGAQQLIQTGEIDPKQLGIDLAIWAGLEGLFVAAPRIANLFKGPVEAVAKETGQTAEQILRGAAEKSGTEFSKVLEGDAAEVNKLRRQVSKEVPEVGKKAEAAPKEFAQTKKEMARRENVAERLKERPLEEYYKEKKETEHKPATIVKQQEVRERVTPLIKEAEDSLKSAHKDVADLKREMPSYTAEQKERANAGIKYYEEIQIPRVKERLQDLKYELKNFRKRPSAEEIQHDVTKSGQKYAEEAKNPTEKGQKDINAQLEKDKKYIESAARIAQLKPIPPRQVIPDTHIRIQKAYLEGYNGMINDLKEEIRNLKGARDAESLKAITDKRKAIKFLEQRTARLKANIQNHTDKLKVQSHLDKPSGAFYKNQLSRVRQDLEMFKKDYFQHIKEKGEGHLKAEKVAGKELKEIPSELKKLSPEERAEFNKGKEQGQKSAEDIKKDPSTENVKEEAKKNDTGQSETLNAAKEIKNAGEKLEQGKATEKDINQTSKAIAKYIKRAAIGVALGVPTGFLQALIEEYTGWKIGSTYIKLLTGEYGIPTFGMATAYKMTSEMFEEREAKRIRTLRGNERIRALESLQNRYSKRRANKISKLVQEE